MISRGDKLFQIMLHISNDALLYSETVKPQGISLLVNWVYKACGQCDFNVVIGNNTKFEEKESLTY